MGIEETRKLLRKFEYKYNCERMYQSLNYLTPMEYYYKLKDKLLNLILICDELGQTIAKIY